MTDEPVAWGNISPPEPPIDELVARYRKLAQDAAAIEAEQKKLKAVLLPVVEASGGWKDAMGYVRIVDRAGSASYPSGDVESLAKAWLQSGDPIMKSCGQMLFAKRTETPGSRYIQIK